MSEVSIQIWLLVVTYFIAFYLGILMNHVSTQHKLVKIYQKRIEELVGNQDRIQNKKGRKKE